jgi:predicted ATPase
MITKAKFQNFKALKDVEITFDSRLTVIVGPNGCGKSSVLQCLLSLSQLTEKEIFLHEANQLQQNLNQTLSVNNSDIQSLELWETNNVSSIGLRIQVAPDKRFTRVNNTQVWDCHIIEQEKETHWPSADHLKRFNCSPTEYIRFDAKKLSEPSLTLRKPPQLETNGTGLASLMSYLRNSDDDRFIKVVDLFRKIIPNIQKVKIDRVPLGNMVNGNLVFGEQLLFDLPTRKNVVASAMSDGTLYMLGLIIKILDPKLPRLLLIDDLDHGFHPRAQLQVIDLLHDLLEEVPDLQIIATSHSPYMLDRLKPNEVRMMNLRDDGTAVCGRLEDHPEFERWNDSMSPGEFWNYFGEDWLKEPKPIPEPAVAP